jgi:hypothetical protein
MMSETPFSLLACGRKSLLRFGDARNFVDATRFAAPKNASVAKPTNKVAMIPITKVLSITS